MASKHNRTLRLSLDAMPEFARTTEVARLLGVGDSTVRGLIRRDELGSIRIGRLLRVPKAAIVEFMRPRGTTR